MLSSTLNLPLFPLFWLQRNKTVTGETAAILCSFCTLNSLISRILSLIVFVLRPPRFFSFLDMESSSSVLKPDLNS